MGRLMHPMGLEEAEPNTNKIKLEMEQMVKMDTRGSHG